MINNSRLYQTQQRLVLGKHLRVLLSVAEACQTAFAIDDFEALDACLEACSGHLDTLRNRMEFVKSAQEAHPYTVEIPALSSAGDANTQTPLLLENPAVDSLG